MNANDLKTVAEAVVQRAQQHGYVLPRQIREHLAGAGLAEALWKDVVALARPSLRLRNGRYHYAPGLSDRARKEQDQQQAIRRAVRQLVRAHRAATAAVERREQNRVEFIQPVKVRAEDGREFTLLSRDVSATGIRLIGTRRLLGQKVRILIPRPGTTEASASAEWSFLVRILWTCAIGDDLFENGGAFMEVTTTTPV